MSPPFRHIVLPIPPASADDGMSGPNGQPQSNAPGRPGSPTGQPTPPGAPPSKARPTAVLGHGLAGPQVHGKVLVVKGPEFAGLDLDRDG